VNDVDGDRNHCREGVARHGKLARSPKFDHSIRVVRGPYPMKGVP
jgi:hypothetical protein